MIPSVNKEIQKNSIRMQFCGIILTILNLFVFCVHSETADKNCNKTSEDTPPIVEYSLDHEVSSKDARAAAMEITDDALNCK